MNRLPEEVIRLQAVLDEYVSIHDSVFKPTLRKKIQIPGFFKAIDFGKHSIELECLAEALNPLCLTGTRTDLPAAFHQYASALQRTIAALREICQKLDARSRGSDNTYGRDQYDGDVAAYHGLVRQYQGIGSELNRQIGGIS